MEATQFYATLLGPHSTELGQIKVKLVMLRLDNVKTALDAETGLFYLWLQEYKVTIMSILWLKLFVSPRGKTVHSLACFTILYNAERLCVLKFNS